MSGGKMAVRPFVKALSRGLIERILDESKDVLEQTGICIQNMEALELLGEGGARIDREARKAFIPRGVVEGLLDCVPSSIKLYDRNGNFAMNLGGTSSYFFPGTAATRIWDSDLNKSRPPLTRDTVDYTRLVDALDNIDGMATSCNPTDVPREIAGHFRLFLALRYTTKVVYGGAFTKEGFQIEKDLLVAIRGSEGALREKPLFVIAACPSPPLKWSDLTCDHLIRAAENSIPVALVSVPMAGSTSPVTICGSLVQHTAETLSGVVISQLVNPGSPVIWGGAPGTTDMRWGTTPMGTNAEGMLINMAYCEIGKYLRIPTLAYMGLSDAKCSDSQAGLESAMGATLAVLAGINMISGAGMMDFIMTHSLEKLLIDNEICRMAHRLTKGITPRAERLAEDLFTEGLYEGTHFFTSPITMQWLRSEEYSYAGPVISKEDRQAWIEKGGTTAEQRAKEEVKKILTCHKPEPLDRDIDKELLRIMTQNAKRYCMSELPLP